ncbi:hypothetical protein [Desulfovibrio sp. JC022]|uniref:hypothetical protein n=1 Tax=Desulfovibrio sp. JC022 TaxID=2593642 RepID=UPI00193F4064|nr:hypothetical protein [Desulfovibrio sp. JC022]
MSSISAFMTEIFTPENSEVGRERKLDPVTGTVKTIFWVGAAMVFTILVSGLQ